MYIYIQNYILYIYIILHNLILFWGNCDWNWRSVFRSWVRGREKLEYVIESLLKCIAIATKHVLPIFHVVLSILPGSGNIEVEHTQKVTCLHHDPFAITNSHIDELNYIAKT